MSSAGAQSGAGGGGSSGAVEITFSAPFYTGVFLSSRELQGDYQCHQNIVIEGMKEKLWGGWSSPPAISEFWLRKVSPSYFIRCSATEESALGDLSSKIEKSLSAIKEIELSDLKVKSLEIKFYEFAFGSVSIKIEGLKLSEDTIDFSEAFKNLQDNIEEKIRKILNCIAEKVTNAYRESVPCCIKNSDIWDINNFGGLEATEGICGIGSVQEINTVIAIHKSDKINFSNLISDLGKYYVDFSEELRNPPFNGSHHMFSTKEQNITIAASMTPNDTELTAITDVSETLGVQLAVGRYFDNFFYSYYNYSSCLYEVVESKDQMFWKNLWGFKNLIEKFLDVQSLYHQTKDLVSKNILHSNCNEYASKLHSTFPENTTINSYFRKADQSIMQLEKQYDEIEFIATKYSRLSIGFSAIAISIVSLAISIAALVINDILLGVLLVPFFTFILFLFFIYGIISLQLRSRKLYYICDAQKKNLREQYDKQEKRNKSKRICICKVSKCHRRRGSEWHSRIFFSDENLCFRCGIPERSE